MRRRLPPRHPQKTAMLTIRLVLVVDASGSMAPFRELVLDGFEDFFRRLPADGISYQVTFVEFADEVTVHLRQAPLADCMPLNYDPSGFTALRDGIADALDIETSNREPVLCLIASDGEENISRRTTQAQLEKTIAERLGWGNWTFLWLNMQGSQNRTAEALAICTLNFAAPRIGVELAELAVRLAGEVRRLQLTGEGVIDITRLLGSAS